MTRLRAANQELGSAGGQRFRCLSASDRIGGKASRITDATFPERKCIGIIWDRASIDQLTAAERQATTLGLEIRSLEMENPPYDFDAALQTLAADGAQMVLFLSSAFFAMQSRRIAELGIQRRLPSMFVFRGYVQDGGLMSYGADPVEMYRQTATYVAKILRGAKPIDP